MKTSSDHNYDRKYLLENKTVLNSLYVMKESTCVKEVAQLISLNFYFVLRFEPQQTRGETKT